MLGSICILVTNPHCFIVDLTIPNRVKFPFFFQEDFDELQVNCRIIGSKSTKIKCDGVLIGTTFIIDKIEYNLKFPINVTKSLSNHLLI